MEILHTEEVATLLKMNRRTVQNNAQDGIYPPTVCTKHGRQYLFNKEALLEWLFNTNVTQAIKVGV